MYRIFVIILVLAALLFPIAAAAEGNVPRAAQNIGKQLDEQMMRRATGKDTAWMSDKALRAARSKITIMGTTPANINNLTMASPLSRQLTEEISRYLMGLGYQVDEIRKGRSIRFDPRGGEFILTREVPKLAETTAYGQAILAGTYIMSSEDVRFNISLLCANSNQTLAKATATVPITPDLKPLLIQNTGPNSGTTPTVYTRLQ